MNALGVVFEDVVLINVPLGLDRSSFAMAPSAEKGHFQRSDRRTRISHRHNVVIAVAVDATRRQVVTAGNSFTVQGM